MTGLLEKEPPQTKTGLEAEREDSLVQQAARFEGHSARSGDRSVSDTESASRVPVPLADGYVRRSPVQTMQISADYYRRRRRRIMGLIALTAVLIALIRILIGTGILAF